MSKSSDNIINEIKSGLMSVQDVPKVFFDDFEVAVFLASYKYGKYFHLISDLLKDDEDLFKLILLENPGLFEHASLKVRSDQNIAVMAVENDTDNYKYIGDELKEDPIVALAAIDYIDGSAWDHISPKLKQNKKFTDRALLKCYHVLQFMPEKYRTKADVIRPYIKVNGQLYYHLSDELKYEEEFINYMLETDPSFFEYTPIEIRDSKDWVLKAVNIYGQNLAYVSERLRDDFDVACIAIKNSLKHNQPIIDYVSGRLKDNLDFGNFILENKKEYSSELSDRLKEEMGINNSI